MPGVSGSPENDSALNDVNQQGQTPQEREDCHCMLCHKFTSGLLIMAPQARVTVPSVATEGPLPCAHARNPSRSPVDNRYLTRPGRCSAVMN